jgi:HK97 gp10 family phage protein
MAKKTFEIINPTALTDYLDRMGAVASESALRQAVVAGARIIRDEAVIRAPKESGLLKRSIIIKHIDEKSVADKLQTYYVTVRSGTRDEQGKKDLAHDAYYWRWVELGHKYVPRKAAGGITTFTQRLSNGKTVTRTREYAENGMTARRRAAAALELEVGSSKKGARPFMRPAYEAKKTEAAQAMIEVIQQMAKEAARGK